MRDIAPSAVGDATGTGVFFYALPMAIVAMVSAIVLLQLGAWSCRRKMLAVTVIGAFTAVVTFLIALWQQVLDLSASSVMLVFGTFVFVLGIGWTLKRGGGVLAAVPRSTALTFVLVLGCSDGRRSRLERHDSDRSCVAARDHADGPVHRLGSLAGNTEWGLRCIRPSCSWRGWRWERS
ncbi:hypothetical protein FXW78_46105 [Rhodococcus opacus]|nr:hypothetical protein [Rhodococcus opacus]